MSQVVRRMLLTGLLACSALAASAGELKLNQLFSDHMVLQQGKAVPVWGWSDAGSKVTVRFGDQTAKTTTNDDGKWSVCLEPLTASAEPQVLRVTSTSHDAVLKVKDVLVGEVWLGSGQSNMAMTVSRALNFEQEKAAADLPLIRVFKESSSASATPNANPKGTWTLCSPSTVGGYSATLFFMGREIQKELDIPVGLIVSAVGGTPIENWIDAEKAAAVPELQKFTTSLTAAHENFDAVAAKARYEKQKAAWSIKAQQAKAAGNKAPTAPRDPVAQHRLKGGPGDLFNGKIAPLVPYAMRGAVWYQGEGNSRPGKSELYQYHMPTLISEWRQLWNDDFPFGMVQLPNYNREGDGWSEVQEAFLKTVRSVPNTGMAITIDVGDPKDIHPKNKQAVGHRLALWALGDVYNKDVPATSGPTPANYKVDGNSIVVSFDHAETGLMAKGGDLVGFQIAGADGQWKTANASIEGSSVSVSHPAVKSPTAIRYAWAANPTCNLYNKAGLPASPFRTGK